MDYLAKESTSSRDEISIEQLHEFVTKQVEQENENSVRIEKWFSPEEIANEINVMRHYAPYIKQEKIAAERAKRDESIQIPKWLDYDKCLAVRYESREKLKQHRPETIAQANRIPGVNPADTAVLAIIIKRGHH